jgi:hypothetical protein
VRKADNLPPPCADVKKSGDLKLLEPCGPVQACKGTAFFLYPNYNRNWRNINTVYVYKTRLASNEIFSPSNKIHRGVDRAKDLSAPRYKIFIQAARGSFNVAALR